MRTTHAAVLSLLAAGSCAALVLVGSHTAEAQCLLESPGLDRSAVDSRQCLVCHDGTAGRVVPLHESHPVGRAYGDAWIARRGHLRAIPAPELVLAGGFVTCATCHDGASSHPASAALPGDRLCQGCHER